jgi:hypothetical protein
VSALEAVELGLTPVEATPSATDLRLWSVTTIIGVLDKPALMYWAAEQTAKAAIASEATWRAMAADQGTDEAVKWLRDARFRPARDDISERSLGTVVHACCEILGLTGARPGTGDVEQLIRRERPKLAGYAVRRIAVEVSRFVDQFERWLEEFSPSFVATEVTVYHPEFGYAGTADGFLTVDGVRFIVDYKTSRRWVDHQGRPTGPYPESALQVAAYRWAQWAAVWRPRMAEVFRRRYYLLGETEQTLAQPVPAVDGGLVIHITPEHCRAHPVRCDQAVFDAFLYVLEAARWSFEMAPTVIGDPLVAP